MAQTKKNAFSVEEQKLAEFARALGHPARIAILKELARHDTCICGEIVSCLPLAQATVSQHLKELLRLGLIKGTVDGKKSCYCIDWETFKRVQKSFGIFFEELNQAKQDQECC